MLSAPWTDEETSLREAKYFSVLTAARMVFSEDEMDIALPHPGLRCLQTAHPGQPALPGPLCCHTSLRSLPGCPPGALLPAPCRALEEAGCLCPSQPARLAPLSRCFLPTHVLQSTLAQSRVFCVWFFGPCRLWDSRRLVSLIPMCVYRA